MPLDTAIGRLFAPYGPGPGGRHGHQFRPTPHHTSCPHNVPPGGHGSTTHLAWRLPSQRFRCRWGCSSSPRREGIAGWLVYYPTYSYVGHNPPTPQYPATRRDLHGQWWPPWCPIPSAVAHNSHPSCCLMDVCGGAGSEASWRPWDEGGHHSQ